LHLLTLQDFQPVCRQKRTRQSPLPKSPEPVTGAIARKVAIESFTTEDGALLLLRRAGRQVDNPHDEPEWQDACALANELGGFPLALDQAGAYIEAKQITSAEYLDRFRNEASRLQLLADGAGAEFRGKERTTVATTWQIAFESIERENRKAGELLRFCSFTAPDDIPMELVLWGSPADHTADVQSMPRLQPPQNSRWCGEIQKRSAWQFTRWCKSYSGNR
jgi:hypothetical protein